MIVAIRADLHETAVLLRCAGCDHEFEVALVSVAGVPIGEHPCPACRAIWICDAECVRRALEASVYGGERNALRERTREATRIACRWYAAPPLDRLLRYKDVDLGSATERELMGPLSEAVMRGAARNDEQA